MLKDAGHIRKSGSGLAPKSEKFYHFTAHLCVM
jgi:hypothetical protein